MMTASWGGGLRRTRFEPAPTSQDGNTNALNKIIRDASPFHPRQHRIAPRRRSVPDMTHHDNNLRTYHAAGFSIRPKPTLWPKPETES
jgi:hypothetical protein